MRTPLRVLGVLAGAVAAVAFAAPAMAHVTVNPSEASAGSFATLTFRVPVEKDIATTKVEIVFDDKAPIAVARTSPVPGWKAEVVRRPLDKPIDVHGREVSDAISSITWTAENENTALKPGEFGQFDVAVGPIPEVDEMVFKALQTYADGEVVRWIDVPKGDVEPEHPAPVVAVSEGSGDHHGSSGKHGASSDEDADTAKTWGIVGTVVGGVALLVSLAALIVSTRRRKA